MDRKKAMEIIRLNLQEGRHSMPPDVRDALLVALVDMQAIQFGELFSIPPDLQALKE